MFNTTICALSTARLNCAIHIIRLSGPQAYAIINKLSEKPIPKQGFRIVHTNIYDQKQIIDNVLINTFVAPHSYTGEDLVEINCHGSVLLADIIINLLIQHGAQMATRGEFTKRAMMNKKIDLAQTEAINNLVHAQNPYAIKGAIHALKGDTSKLIQESRDELFQLIGQIEVNIDYPEYSDIEEITAIKAQDVAINIITKLRQLWQNSKRFIPLNEGIKVLILGEPNSGKSTLLNALTQTNKAIVSDIPGTTRDVIEASINIDDITLKLYDTAGLRVTSDTIEQLGIAKALNYLKDVDLVLLLQPLNNLNLTWITQYSQELQNIPYLIVYTKADLVKNVSYASDKDEIIISAKQNKLESLISKIKQLFEVCEFEHSDMNVLQSQRQISLLAQAIQSLEDSLKHLDNHEPLDLVVENFSSSLNSLNQILGLDYEYDFLDELFKNFCLGK